MFRLPLGFLGRLKENKMSNGYALPIVSELQYRVLAYASNMYINRERSTSIDAEEMVAVLRYEALKLDYNNGMSVEELADHLVLAANMRVELIYSAGMTVEECLS
ncbi:MAG: hypothetical protein AABW46_03375 [Nanoarchaeota archaeon]